VQHLQQAHGVVRAGGAADPDDERDLRRKQLILRGRKLNAGPGSTVAL
jgi:hypothetical protein